MYRDAEQQLKSALKHQDSIDTYLYLCKVYIRLDQPLTAVDVYKQGLEKFQNETSLLSGIARIYEVSTHAIMIVFTGICLKTQEKSAAAYS